jgi:hypothetical protein
VFNGHPVPSRTTILRAARPAILVVVCLIGGGAAYLMIGRETKTAQTQPWPPGFFELLDCTYTASMDGTKELDRKIKQQYFTTNPSRKMGDI